jgi:predicted nucleotidyltransferase
VAVDEAIRQVLARDGRIAFALLFGSAARRETTPLSDVDIAIGLSPGAPFGHHDRGDLASRLEEVTGRPIDLVVLNGAAPGLAYRAFRDGRMVLERDHAARVEAQARAILEYLDFKPVEEMLTRGVLKAIGHG